MEPAILLQSFQTWRAEALEQITHHVVSGEETHSMHKDFGSFIGNQGFEAFVSEHRIDIQNYAKIVIERDMLYEENESLHQKVRDYIQQVHSLENSLTAQKETILKLYEEAEKYKHQIKALQSKGSSNKSTGVVENSASHTSSSIAEAKATLQTIVTSLKSYDVKGHIERKEYEECLRSFEKNQKELELYKQINSQLTDQIAFKNEEIYLLQSEMTQIQRVKQKSINDLSELTKRLQSLQLKEEQHFADIQRQQTQASQLYKQITRSEEHIATLQDKLSQALQVISMLEKEKEQQVKAFEDSQQK
jgi:chromosome segregation ATPase